jgi:hypothetical protein
VNGVFNGYVYVRAYESEGAVGLSVRNSRSNSFASPEVLWEAHDPVAEIYISGPSFGWIGCSSGIWTAALRRRSS